MAIEWFEIDAPPEIVAAFHNAVREGVAYVTWCPNCSKSHRRSERKLRFLPNYKGRPWWGCMRCDCQKDYAAAKRTAKLRFQYDVDAARVDEQRLRDLVLRIWEKTSVIRSGDPVDRYLREQRKLKPLIDAWPIDLRWGRIKYRDERIERWYDGMVAAVRDVAGNLIAIHRTYLLEDGRRADSKDLAERFRVANAKKSLGSTEGGSVQLYGERSDPMFGVAEGIETSLAFSMYLKLPCRSTLSASGMQSVIFPKTSRYIFIGPDIGDPGKGRNKEHDRSKGVRSAVALQERLLEEARKDGRPLSVRLRPPPLSGRADWNDWAKSISG